MDANPASATTPLRDRLPLAPKREQYFRWRGHEVSRLEGFSDAVFAFAVTLLVVALEVPHSYDKLMEVMRGFPAFVICFVLLMMFWNAHYRFFRRYGVENGFSRVATLAVLVLVLFFVYPLKFLFTVVTADLFGNAHSGDAIATIDQLRNIYVLYGLGLAAVWGLYAALYAHALRHREQLQLDAAEIIQTRGSLAEYLITVGVCLLSVILAIVTVNRSMPGWIYCLLAPLLTFNGWWHGRQVRALYAAS